MISIYNIASNVINYFTTVRQRQETDYPAANDSEIRRITDETYTNSIYAATNTAEDLLSSNGCEKEKVKNNDQTDNNKRHTPDQEALDDLAKEAIKKGKQGNPISQEEAEIFDEWVDEYGIRQHHQAGEGTPGHWEGGEHTHWYGKHIPYQD